MKRFRTLSLTTLFTALLVAGPAAHAAERVVVLTIPGMICATCPVTIKHALSRLDGVKKTNIDLEGKEAWVTFDDQKASVAALIRATTDAGYPASVKP
ncbi:mercury resistance system periplasmic binding protein MerP [Chitinasiproducens palmae]|uniref:Periplasmic mercury ion-binding protein n=1 Tax=Chitinasiproducens palmae TaxID=1770053 RepID=A0A1H2PXW9_9BURK|nr:mercury resistance system periplasmic binding protein MerP [Chitinasiproducens palmae]SDV51497.1 mercuric ion binding protein [Chitinasiproducens palmae]